MPRDMPKSLATLTGDKDELLERIEQARLATCAASRLQATEPATASPTDPLFFTGLSHLMGERDAIDDTRQHGWNALTEPGIARVVVHEARIKAGLVGRRAAQTFDAYAPVTSSQSHAKALCEKFARVYNPALSDGGVPGLTLYSPPSNVGCGKSHLMNAIGNALLARSFRPVRYVRIKQFTDALKASFQAGSNTEAVWREYLAPRVVLLDDLGKEDLGRDREWTLNQIFELASEWDNLGTRVIRTTNDTDAQLAARYGGPLASRIIGFSAGHTLLVDGPDQRASRPAYDSFLTL